MNDIDNAFTAAGIDGGAQEVEVDHTIEESGSMFDTIAEATTDKSATELIKEAKAEVKEAQGHDTDDSIQASTTRNASEKQPQDAASELNEQAEQDIINLVKAIRGDKEYEIAEDAMFKLKVDGEEIDVPFAELRNNYAGKQAWDKKFTELDSERKEYMQDKQSVTSMVEEFAEIAQSGDKLKAMEFLATVSGQDALQFRRDLRSQLYNELTARQGMNESEVKALELQEELDFMRRQTESENQKQIQSQATLEAENQVAGIQETYNLSDQELVSLYDNVVSKHDSLSDAQLVEALEQEALNGAAINGAEYLLGKVNPELVTADASTEVANLILANPDFTEDELVEIITEAYADLAKPSKQVSRKAKSAAKQVSTKKVVTTGKANYSSFDDLGF